MSTHLWHLMLSTLLGEPLPPIPALPGRVILGVLRWPHEDNDLCILPEEPWPPRASTERRPRQARHAGSRTRPSPSAAP